LEQYEGWVGCPFKQGRYVAPRTWIGTWNALR
jgi:hypothetical protein